MTGHLSLISTCDTVANDACSSHRAATCDKVATGKSLACPFERKSLLDELSSRGIRITSQRRAVVAIIQEADEHLDAATLLRLAREREPDLDRATVYRTIELLKRLRLVDELELMGLKGDGHSYEVRTRRDHIHLACFECGRVEEFSSVFFERLKTEVLERSGFEPGICRLEMGGLCGTCKEKKKEGAPLYLSARK